MKFGKQIQKKQLEIPEYAAAFVDYKALKKLIKELKNSPVTRPGSLLNDRPQHLDPQLALQANKAPFFFRLDRELDKVNEFYKVKEAESRVRLRVLIDKQRSMRMRNPVISKNSTHYVTLEQGFRDFIRDLSKLQQFIEINATAFSKILKKWDKTSKSQTKELYLSRAVEIQPVFNRDVISELSDQASTSLLDCAAWAEGDGTQYGGSNAEAQVMATPRLEQNEADSDIMDALNRGDVPVLRDLLSHFEPTAVTKDRVTRAFLTTVSSAPKDGLSLLLETGMVDLNRQDEINDRNCLHKTAMAGRQLFLRAALAGNVDPAVPDAYGRIPLHYASMNGHVDCIEDLIKSSPSTVDKPDLDDFTPLIHAITHSHLKSVDRILSYAAHVDPIREGSHIPLNLACQHGSVALMKLLLERRPQILPDAEGLYPQHLVARCGTDPQLLLLLQHYGADLNQPDKLYQWTPLFHAASEGRVDCLRTLLDSGVSTSALDEKGQSALYYATWEGHLMCMDMLAPGMPRSAQDERALTGHTDLARTDSSNLAASTGNIEMIPDLSLPPPIIPTRRYGHNFLDSKSTVLLIFGEEGRNAVTFYDESKYPAARLTITPRSSDVLPRNLLLPIQEENRCVAFEMDSLETFAVDFDVFPTFGKKVLAKGSVPPEVFRNKHTSSGHHHLSLFDPRLRAVGQISFKYQVIQPFRGLGLDIMPFATYWKATSQFDSAKPSSLVTGSSLSGEYIRIPVQTSLDAVPMVYPTWTFCHAGLEVPVVNLTRRQFSSLSAHAPDKLSHLKQLLADRELATAHRELASLHASLEEVLRELPTDVNVELHILYPSEQQEEALRFGPSASINDFVDAVLKVVFQHARDMRDQHVQHMRSIVFSSYNSDLCTALNWKQPNFPVLLCNDLGVDVRSSPIIHPAADHPNGVAPAQPDPAADASSRTLSVKDAVRIATSNNFMGLISRARLLDAVPALIEAIKVAGLVLVSDASAVSDVAATRGMTSAPPFAGVPEGIDGIVREEGVLRFIETVDM